MKTLFFVLKINMILITITLTLVVAAIAAIVIATLDKHPAKVAAKHEKLIALGLEYDNATTDVQREEIQTRINILVFGSLEKASKALK